MSTSVIDNKCRALKTAFVYLVIAVITALFGAIYEMFGHGVYSYYMIYAFAIPLVFGTLTFFSIGLFGIKIYPSDVSLVLYHLSLATFTVGSIMKGVLDIYGTTNSLLIVYLIAGESLLLASLICYLSALTKK